MPSGVGRAAAVSLWVAAGSAQLLAQDVAPRRYFANVPFAIDVTSGPVFSPQHIAEDSNMVALHFDFWGVPWLEFGTGAPLPPAWLAAMDRVTVLRDELKLPVYLALTPLAGRRDGLAPRASGSERLDLDGSFSPPCEPLMSRADGEVLKAGYKAYVEHMVARYAPTFLAISIEVNLYAQTCPGAWEDVKQLLNEVYAEQKARRPESPVFNTYHVDSLWEAGRDQRCFGFSTRCLDENLLAMDGLETDVFALSSYPLAPYNDNAKRLPDEWMTIFAALTGKPLAIAETGFRAATLTIRNPTDPESCFDALPSSTTEQRLYLRKRLDDAEAAQMPFVTWWGNHDFMPAEFSEPCRCEAANIWCEILNSQPDDDALIFRFFATIGLREHDGTPRDALIDWRAAVQASQ